MLVCACMLSHFSCVQLFVTLWTVSGSSLYGTLQASILEWVDMPPPGDLPHLGIEPATLMSPASAGGFFTTSATWEAHGSVLLLLLSHFSRVWLYATPQRAAHQAPPSLGFFRQEHWSGLPFPSPMHESEKWKWSRSVVPDSLRPHGLQPTRLLCLWDFPGKSTGVGCHCLLRC